MLQEDQVYMTLRPEQKLSLWEDGQCPGNEARSNMLQHSMLKYTRVHLGLQILFMQSC